MTDQEALELGLALAELDSQLKARGTLATIEEMNELFRLIKERRAAEREKHQRPSPDLTERSEPRHTFAVTNKVSHSTIRQALYDVEGGLPEYYDWGGLAEDCLIAAAKEAKRNLIRNIESLRVFVEDPGSILNQQKGYHRLQKRAFRESQIALVALRWVIERQTAPWSEDRSKEKAKAIEKLWKYRRVLAR